MFKKYAILVNETNASYTSINPCRLPLTFTLFFIYKVRLTTVISVQCVVRGVVRVYLLCLDLIMKKCLKCEKKFEPKNLNNLYCSISCRRRNQNTKCNHCGKIFKHTGSKSFICSKECKKEYFLTKYPPKNSKVCKLCKDEKYYKKFRRVYGLVTGPNKGKIIGWRTKQNNDYRASRCLECEKNIGEKKYLGNPFPQMRSNAKIRAKADGTKFNISTEYIKSIFPKNKKCPVLGIEFDMGYKSGKTNKYAPSLDKIIPELGYVEGNVKIVSIIVNRLKSDANYDDMEKILKYYLDNKQFSKNFYKNKK